MEGNINIRGLVGINISRSRETEDILDIKQNMKHEKIKETLNLYHISIKQKSINIYIDLPDLLSEQLQTELRNAVERVLSRYIKGK